MYCPATVLLVSAALLCLGPGAALSQDAPTFDIPDIAVPAIEVPSVPPIEFTVPSGTPVGPPAFSASGDQDDLKKTIEDLLAVVRKVLPGFGDSIRGGTP